MIQSRDLTYKYQGGPQIRFPDFQVASGEVLLILGESGCGKTTLLHLLAGLRRPTTGQIKLDQQQLTDLPSNALDQFRGQNIGMVYQQSYFIEALSIEENLLLSPYVVDKQRATSIANKLGIGDQLK
ncbi:MAG: ATP-binding cassette domain-containing protein, partial [Cyanobacteria bacterium J06649_11]